MLRPQWLASFIFNYLAVAYGVMGLNQLVAACEIYLWPDRVLCNPPNFEYLYIWTKPQKR